MSSSIPTILHDPILKSLDPFWAHYICSEKIKKNKSLSKFKMYKYISS